MFHYMPKLAREKLSQLCQQKGWGLKVAWSSKEIKFNRLKSWRIVRRYERRVCRLCRFLPTFGRISLVPRVLDKRCTTEELNGHLQSNRVCLFECVPLGHTMKGIGETSDVDESLRNTDQRYQSPVLVEHRYLSCCQYEWRNATVGVLADDTKIFRQTMSNENAATVDQIAQFFIDQF